MVVSTFRGQVPRFDVTLTADESGGLRLAGPAPVSAIVTADESLTAHLGSPDFFDTERHPDLRFVSTSVQRGEGDRVTVRGELTMKGITRPVELCGTLEGPVRDPLGATRLGLLLEGSVDRRDYELRWQMPLPDGGLALGNEVRLSAQLELVRDA
jgi:polyisoprenoid-binding protein YceI